MELAYWEKKYETGVVSIDNQHQRLFEMVNNLFNAVKNKSDVLVIEDVIKMLEDYTIYHFQNEEKIFDETGYPDTEKHKAQHKNFTDRIADFKARMKTGKAVLSVSVLSFLWTWLNEHILESDMQYVSHFKSKNIQ